MSRRWLWIAEYQGCGCSLDSPHKSDLLEYCPKHGSDRIRLTKLPFPESYYDDAADYPPKS